MDNQDKFDRDTGASISTLEHDLKEALRHKDEEEDATGAAFLRAWDAFLVTLGVTKDIK